jgi:cobaltochelatase CobS
MKLRENKTAEIIAYFKSKGIVDTVSSAEVYAYAKLHDLTGSQYKELFSDKHKLKRGLISLTPLTSSGQAAQARVVATATPTFAMVQSEAKPEVKTEINMSVGTTADIEDIYVPAVDPCYVPWGEYSMVKQALESRQFYPIFIAGLSGNGKTVMVEQACAKLKREYIRVQISKSTDEDDLIGGFRLVNGETKFFKGPVIRAYERGAVLLVDEIDRGTNNLMCLQGILEGKPVLIKKTGELIHPAKGFTVVATANTKGRGSEDGRYSGALVIDDAFLERFVATIEQEYPSATVELKIISNHMEKFSSMNSVFAENLVAWASAIRATFANGGVDEVISTRRLCHIVQSYGIFRDEKTAIRMCVSRFDANTRDSFIELFDKLVAPVTGKAPATPPVQEADKSNVIPF